MSTEALFRQVDNEIYHKKQGQACPIGYIGATTCQMATSKLAAAIQVFIFGFKLL
jgi:hypothetical protein